MYYSFRRGSVTGQPHFGSNRFPLGPQQKRLHLPGLAAPNRKKTKRHTLCKYPDRNDRLIAISIGRPRSGIDFAVRRPVAYPFSTRVGSNTIHLQARIDERWVRINISSCGLEVSANIQHSLMNCVACDIYRLVGITQTVSGCTGFLRVRLSSRTARLPSPTFRRESPSLLRCLAKLCLLPFLLKALVRTNMMIPMEKRTRNTSITHHPLFGNVYR